MQQPLISRIALALNDEHGSICPGKGAKIIEPVGKRATSKRQVAFGVPACFKLGRLEDEKDGLPVKKEGLR